MSQEIPLPQNNLSHVRFRRKYAPPPKGDKFPRKYVLGVPNFLGNLAPGGWKINLFFWGEGGGGISCDRVKTGYAFY